MSSCTLDCLHSEGRQLLNEYLTSVSLAVTVAASLHLGRHSAVAGTPPVTMTTSVTLLLHYITNPSSLFCDSILKIWQFWQFNHNFQPPMLSGKEYVCWSDVAARKKHCKVNLPVVLF